MYHQHASALKIASALQYASDIGVYGITQHKLKINPRVARLFARYYRALSRIQRKETSERLRGSVRLELVVVSAELEICLLNRSSILSLIHSLVFASRITSVSILSIYADTMEQGGTRLFVTIRAITSSMTSQDVVPHKTDTE